MPGRTHVCTLWDHVYGQVLIEGPVKCALMPLPTHRLQVVQVLRGSLKLYNLTSLVFRFGDIMYKCKSTLILQLIISGKFSY